MFYFDISRAETTNATANTEDTIGRLLTVANQLPCRLLALYLTGRETTAGGVIMRLKRMATAGTVGTAITPNEREPKGPAAETTAFSGSTAGATPTQSIAAGVAGTGGQGAWLATEKEAALVLDPNGGANGNVDMTDIAGQASVDYDYTLEFCEG